MDDGRNTDDERGPCDRVIALKGQNSSWFPARWVSRFEDGKFRFYCGDSSNDQLKLNGVESCLPQDSSGQVDGPAFVRLHWDPNDDEYPQVECARYVSAATPGEPLEACRQATAEALQNGDEGVPEEASVSCNMAEVLEARVPLETSALQRCAFLTMSEAAPSTPWVKVDTLKSSNPRDNVTLNFGPSRAAPDTRTASWCKGKAYIKMTAEKLGPGLGRTTHRITARCSDSAAASPAPPPTGGGGPLLTKRMLLLVGAGLVAAVIGLRFFAFRAKPTTQSATKNPSA
jgi:hypothetical protein